MYNISILVAMEFKKKEEIVFPCFWFLFRARVLQLVNHLSFFLYFSGFKVSRFRVEC